MERRKFTREFKLEAVRLIKERGVSRRSVSRGVASMRGRHGRAVGAAEAMKSWARRFAQASSPAIEPMAALGECGATCWRRACRVDCIGSSD